MDALIFMCIAFILTVREVFGEEEVTQTSNAGEAAELVVSTPRETKLNETGYHDQDAFMYIFKQVYGDK